MCPEWPEDTLETGFTVFGNTGQETALMPFPVSPVHNLDDSGRTSASQFLGL